MVVRDVPVPDQATAACAPVAPLAPVIIVGFRNPNDVVACLSGLAKVTEGASLGIFICENGGESATKTLVQTLLDGPCAVAAPSPSFGDRFRSVTSLCLRDSKAPVFVGEAKENYGYAGGINAWLEPLLSKLGWTGVWLLNPDTIPSPEALGALIGQAESRQLGMVGSRLVASFDADKIDVRGLRWRRLMAKTLGVGLNAPVAETPTDGAVERELQAAAGASFYVTRPCVEKVGLMREDFFLYYEDLDWGLRARRLGVVVGYAHGSIVVHTGGTTIGSASGNRAGSPLAVYLEFRNRIAFVRSHYPRWLAWSVLMTTLHALRLLPSGGSSTAISGLWAGLRGQMGRPDHLLGRYATSL